MTYLEPTLHLHVYHAHLAHILLSMGLKPAKVVRLERGAHLGPVNVNRAQTVFIQTFVASTRLPFAVNALRVHMGVVESFHLASRVLLDLMA